MQTAAVKPKPRYQVEASRLGRMFQRLYAVVDAEGRPVFQTDDPNSAEDHCDRANRVYIRRAKPRAE